MTRPSTHLLLQPFLRAAAATFAVLALCAALPAVAQVVTARPAAPHHRRPSTTPVRATLAGSRPPRALPADDIGAVPPPPLHGISLVFSRSAAQQAALDALVAAQQNPASPLYHQWITPDQYAAQFGVADSDIAAAETWLAAAGLLRRLRLPQPQPHLLLRNRRPGRRRLRRSAALLPHPATASSLRRTHFAPSADLTLPAALASSVLAVGNLSRLPPRPAHPPSAQARQPRFTSSQTGNHYLTPGDLATIYDITPAYNSGYSGSGQSIAVVGQSAISLSDITNFQAAAGIAANTPILILVPGSGTSSLHRATKPSPTSTSSTPAPSPKARRSTSSTPATATTMASLIAIEYAIDNSIAPIISPSYGECEPDLGQADFNQLQRLPRAGRRPGPDRHHRRRRQRLHRLLRRGQLRHHRNEQLAVSFPASSQYVTGMGGTEFPAADVASGNNTYFDADHAPTSSAPPSPTSPRWPGTTTPPPPPTQPGSQCTPSPPAAAASASYTRIPPGRPEPSAAHLHLRQQPPCARHLPHRLAQQRRLRLLHQRHTAPPARQASCTNGLATPPTGVLTVAGGTSFDAPIFAGMLAIINQAKDYATGQGIINPTLYSLAANLRLRLRLP